MKLNRRMFLATTTSAAVLTALAYLRQNGSVLELHRRRATAAPEELRTGVRCLRHWLGAGELERRDRGRQRR